MKIGYPCINTTLDCKGNKTFRLKSYSEDRLIETVDNNISCLEKMLEYNIKHELLFFRISSDIVPFASHPVCTFNWQHHFAKKLKSVGEYIKKYSIRISMHPDQFVLINTPKKSVLENSVKELIFHAELLDLMELERDHKIQIHVGGVYGDKEVSMQRFIERYKDLPKIVKNRLAIENDDRSYSLQDCLQISEKIGIPIIFDTFHHELFNNGETLKEAAGKAAQTWGKNDGTLMIDYSTQEPDARTGKHATHIQLDHFKEVEKTVRSINPDIMLEIKDKELSALAARKSISLDS